LSNADALAEVSVPFVFSVSLTFFLSLSLSLFLSNSDSQSAVSPEFWAALGAAKLDEWKLSEEPREIYGNKIEFFSLFFCT
jgi:hypothetical protein